MLFGFRLWSPSHTILLVVTVGTIVVGFIGQVAVLFYRTRQLEKRLDQTDSKLEKVKTEINDRISAIQGEIGNSQIKNSTKDVMM